MIIERIFRSNCSEWNEFVEPDDYENYPDEYLSDANIEEIKETIDNLLKKEKDWDGISN